MAIQNITFENYKAFDRGDIDIRPLTIFLGANSSGKSSLMHLFLLLEQTFNDNENYKSAFRTNGYYVNMGEDENLLKDKNTEKLLKLDFPFSQQAYNEEMSDVTFKLSTEYALYHIINNKNVSGKDSLWESDELLKQLYSGDNFYGSKSYLDYFLYKYRNKRNNKEKTSTPQESAAFSSLLKEYKMINYNTQKAGKFHIALSFDKNTKKLTVETCEVYMNEKLIIGYINQERNYVKSDIFNNEIINQYFGQGSITFNGLEINANVGQDNNISKFIYSLFHSAYIVVSREFLSHKIKYVGPLRAFPQRYYLLDQSNHSGELDYKDAKNLAEILKTNTRIKNDINKWMSRFDLSINVEEFKDIIHNIKVSQNNLSLDITDVGFGISQILPILVTGFSSTIDSTILIEQPEIHLHPKMQAELADLFVDIINKSEGKKGKLQRTLIVETHSEYLLKRIRRRISDKTIKARDVAIYFIHPRSLQNPNSATIERINITEKGEFEWPEDFYSTSLEDDYEFFKNTAK